MKTRAGRSCILAILTAALAASCGEVGPSAPLEPASHAARDLAAAPQILACPAAEAQTTSEVVGPLGGSLTLAGNRLSIPPGAVLVPTRFTLTVPASEEVKVQVHAEGVEHYQFVLPVSLTLSYARCDPEATAGKSLQVLYVDPLGTVLQLLGGSSDSVSRSVTTSTDHLSEYAVGMN